MLGPCPEKFDGTVKSLPKRAKGSAVMFIQTSIENGLDPYKYLDCLPKAANNADLTDTVAVTALLPSNAPKECSVSVLNKQKGIAAMLDLRSMSGTH